ncbi:MAG: hypothetical protein FJ288_06240 [Planctomycetes bacterium]|nr:hypothetical protein [Planctomycetota bacterium]
MMLATGQHYVLPPWIPTALVYLMAAAAVVAWALAHRVTRSIRAAGTETRRASEGGRALAFTARVAVGFVAMLAAAQAMQRGLVLATNWPIWPIALGGAAAVEVVLALYAMERRTVPGGVGLALAVLRVALVALVVVMLAQPVRPWTLDKTIQRFVAVLVDDSASMYVPDSQLTPSEKMRLAEKFGVAGVRRAPALDAAAETLEKMRADLSAQGEWLASLSSAAPDERQKQLQARRDALKAAFQAAEQKAADILAAVAGPIDLVLSPDAVLRLEDVRKRLGAGVRDRLREAVTLTAAENARNLEREHGRLLEAVRQTTADLADVAARTAALGQTLDELAYAALAPDLKGRVDAAASRKRIALARDVLLKRPALEPAKGDQAERGPSLLDELQNRYAAKLYTFASAPAEVDAKQWAETYAAGGANPPADAAALPPGQQQTDLASAVEKVMTEMADKQLSGVLLLTDGRHNAAKPVEPLVRRLGLGQVAVSSVVFGGERPPIDAGILSVEAPETAATRDSILMTVQLKLDGLAGREVKVSLLDGDKTVNTQTVRVPTDGYRARVQLADEPEAAGLHRYRVDLEKFEGEVLTANNQYPVAVSVTDERTKLLLVDGRPRWEFRYLKNLFATRDKTVRLQYVLLEPDRIDGVPPATKTEASASRPLDEVEASLLPKDEAEWMKFDVIILGDVGPKHLTEQHFRILNKFVADRGGTLVVVAGPVFMPHAYGGTPLAEVLPVVFKREDRPVLAGPEKSFRVALTAEGRESVIMRQKVTPEENVEAWDALPEIFWRHPIMHTKEGATVLAYAMPPSPPDFLPKRAAAGPADGAAEAAADDDDILRKRRDFQRENALIAYHGVAMGQVMFLAFDHTWRLRYRVGDTYHHRFWGQVLRWATANKLPAGTETVKLGTDRSRYAPQAPVRVRAKLAQKDYTPIVSEDVAVNVFEGDQLRLHKKLRYIENSPGMYAAELGELPGGTYRVELDAPPARAVLAEQNAEKVSTEFSVEPSTPAEQAELAPDRGLLARLAALTGGTVADPARAERILASLGKPTEVQIERHEYVLWDSWPLLVLMVLAATAEWLLRKKVGLA